MAHGNFPTLALFCLLSGPLVGPGLCTCQPQFSFFPLCLSALQFQDELSVGRDYTLNLSFKSVPLLCLTEWMCVCPVKSTSSSTFVEFVT